MLPPLNWLAPNPNQDKRVCQQTLEERFKDDFAFEPIAVVPELGHYGDPYLRVYIVASGNWKKLAPGGRGA